MKSAYYFFFLLLFVLSCKSKTENNQSEIIIEGNVLNVPEGKIYLSESNKWRTPIDSAIISNGHFIFTLKNHSSFEPFVAAIHFWDSSGVTRLIYRNHTLAADSMKFATDVFFLEPGQTIISGDNNTPPFLRVFAGNENELMYKNQFVDFGWIENLDGPEKIAKIETFKKIIQQNRSSLFLLQSIYQSREQYSKEQLANIFSLFSDKVRSTRSGELFKNYLSIRPDDGEPLPNLLLENTEDSLRHIFNPSSKVNMLVFWASWCTPCLKEIPMLKEIKKDYPGKDFNMISISIDENKNKWLKAVSTYNMSWPQVHVSPKKIEKVYDQFQFKTIPLVIFTDQDGREIKRFPDYDPENRELYREVISKYIK